MSDQKTEQKHAPGPWSYEDNPYGHDAIYGADGRLIAHVFGDDAQAQEDARLIAAAPELLEALREAVERERNPFEPDNQSRYYLKWSALIAKATGGPRHD